MGNLNCMKPKKRGETNIGDTQYPLSQTKKITTNSKALESSLKIILGIKFSASDMIIENSGDIRKDYIIEQEMGTGAFGEVVKACHKASGIKRAIKVIKKESTSLEEQQKLINEVGILKTLDHPNIIKIIEFYQSPTHFYIVMHLCTGGELFDKISKSGNFNEKKAAETIRQILSAVFYCHHHKIVHRDLKPENLLYENKKENSLLKVIDFGTSIHFDPEKKMKQKSGTVSIEFLIQPYYIAPEVIKRRYDEKCDVWSVGIILYILLCGYPPFNGDNDQEIMEAVIKGFFSFESEEWILVSAEAKTFIKSLLEYNPQTRVSAGDALNDPWMKKFTSIDNIEIPLLQKTLDNLKSFRIEKKLQEATYMFFVNHLSSEEEKKELLKTFQALDTNNDGELSRDELIAGFKKSGKSVNPEKEVDEMMALVDTNKNGTIDYSEFVMATINKEQLLNRQRLEVAFRMIDKDNSGTITINELKEMFGGKNSQISDEMWKEMVNEFDSNSDGEISLNEFKSMMFEFLGKSKQDSFSLPEKQGFQGQGNPRK